MSRFFKKAAFPVLLAAAVFVLAGSFSALANVGVVPERPYWFTSISGGVPVDPLHFGQRTLSDISIDVIGNKYILQFQPEYYIEPDQPPASADNLLYSEINNLYVYSPISKEYVICDLESTGRVLVPTAYVLSNDVQPSERVYYFSFIANFQTYLKNGSNIGEFYWKDVNLKLPFGPDGPAGELINVPVWF